MGSQVSVTFELGVITNVHRNVDTDRMIPIRLNRNIKYQGGGEAFASSCPNVKLHAEIAYNTVAHTVSGCIVLYRPRHFFLKPIQLPAVCPAYVPAQPRPGTLEHACQRAGPMMGPQCIGLISQVSLLPCSLPWESTCPVPKPQMKSNQCTEATSLGLPFGMHAQGSQGRQRPSSQP